MRRQTIIFRGVLRDRRFESWRQFQGARIEVLGVGRWKERNGDPLVYVEYGPAA